MSSHEIPRVTVYGCLLITNGCKTVVLPWIHSWRKIGALENISFIVCYTSPSFQVEFQLPTFYIEYSILYIWVFPKIGGKPPKWMVYYNGKPYETWDDLFFFSIIFGNNHIYIYMCVVCVSTLGRLQQNSSKNT